MSPLLWPTQIAHRKTQKKTNKTNCNYHGKSAREAGQLLLPSSCSSPSSLGATTEATASSASSWHSPDFAEHIVGVSPLRVAITFAYLHATASRLQIVANASELSMNGRPTRSVVSRLAKDCCECASVCVDFQLKCIGALHYLRIHSATVCDCVCTPSCLSKLAFNDVDARSASGNIAAYNYGHSNNNNA